MDELGFSEIKKPVMLNSVGRFMTIPKGAKTKGIEMIDIILALKKNGFAFDKPDTDEAASATPANNALTKDEQGVTDGERERERLF